MQAGLHDATAREKYGTAMSKLNISMVAGRGGGYNIRKGNHSGHLLRWGSCEWRTPFQFLVFDGIGSNSSVHTLIYQGQKWRALFQFLGFGGVGSNSSVVHALYQGQRWSNFVDGMFPNFFTEGLDYSDETARQHIHILLCVIQQEQIALSEAAVRLTAFMRELPSEAPPKELLAPFESLAKVTSHIPIYDDFLSLPESEQQHYDEERHLLEQAHREDLLSATSELLKVFS